MASLAFLCLLAAGASAAWTDQWAIAVDGSIDAAHAIARKHGFEILGEVHPGIYHARHNASQVVRDDPSHHLTRRLQGESGVLWARQHEKLMRNRRGPVLNDITVNDPLWSSQWYMNGDAAHDIDALPAWNMEYSGRNVVVTVVDDGIEHDHPDLAPNYDATASWDMNGNDDDPMPNEADPINSHGTRCCGQIAMVLNNGVCGAGIAYNARIGGIRMLDGDVTDSIESRSLGWRPDHVMIYTNSWGPNDDGATMEGPGPLAEMALRNGVTKGRGGKGSVFLFANGNGGASDNCNADGYANNLYTISIGAIDINGNSPWYSEQCAALMAVTYSSGSGTMPSIASVDLHHGCTRNHGGTSAASPMAAGIVALMLEANPALSWRDVQHVLVHTSKRTAPSDPDWTANGAGWYVNHKYGFGSMDAEAIVQLAATWVPVGEVLTHVTPTMAVNQPIPFAMSAATALKATVTIAEGDTTIRRLEHVQVAVNLDAQRRGTTEIELTSPSGTKSVLLTLRPYDYSNEGIHWTFLTVRCWDESPLGLWTLTVRNGVDGSPGKLTDWTLFLYGTAAA